MTDRTLLVGIFNEAQRWSLSEAELDRLRAAVEGAGVRVAPVHTRHELLDRIDDAELLMGLPLADSQLVGRGGSLRLVQLVTPYAESLAPIARVIGQGARVAGTAPIRAPAVAEHAVGLLLMMLRHLDDAVHAQASHQWASAVIARSVHDLAGATVGLVDLGPVGVAIAERLAPFGCELVATVADGAPTGPVARTLAPSSVDEVLGRSDVVILADDRPGRMRPILDRALFEQLSPGALLVNVASGMAFTDRELLRALRRGRLAGAALDVFEHRPLPATSPLWNAPDVLITPAVASASPSNWRRAVGVTVENIRRFDADEPLLGEITLPVAAPVG